MKKYLVLLAVLLGLAAFMFAQANTQTAQPQTSSPSAAPPLPPGEPDNDQNLKTTDQGKDSHAASTQTPDYSQPQDRDRDKRDRDAAQNQDRDRDAARDQNRDRDAAQNQDRDRQQVYDRDQVYQDQDKRGQQDADRDRDRDNDMDRAHDRDHDRDMNRDRDRSRVGVGGGDVQSQIYAALHNNREFSDVNVAVNGNRIELTGSVPTGKDRKEAVRVAQSYANGMRVDDRLKVSGRGHDRDDNSY